MHGQGELKWPDGRQYIGNFHHGMMQGFGKLTFNTTFGWASYKGEFKNNKFEGEGKLVWSNGSSFEGEFS